MSVFPDFAAFFEACTGHPPYPWQQALADELRAAAWPDAVDVPTGLGKTAALLAGVYEAARQVHAGEPRTVPQRIFHVVDRKIVVDQTHDLLDEAARRVNAGDGVLGPVRDALTSLAGAWGDTPLVVARVHGEAPDLRTWLRPTGVTIVTLTPHQAVTRLLFRGLGVSERTRSLHAGLMGVDAAFVIDEPHLSHQAVATIGAVLGLEATPPLGLPASTMTLLGASVPPEMQQGGRVLTLGAEDLTHTRERERLEAARPVHLLPGPMTTAALVKRIAALVAEERALSPERRIGVVVNHVALAQTVFAALKEPAEHKALVTSRFRPLDRGGSLLERRTVVATQTVEVGVDVSFDVLITEECPWPSLQQRIGRLNRDGGSAAPRAHLLIGEDDASPSPATTAIYGEPCVVATRRLLRRWETAQGVDLSVASQRARAEQIPADVWPEPPRIATFHSGFLPTMQTTFPTPFSDLPVAAFVAGPERQESLDVLVCWRADPALAAVARPLPAEQVAVPLPALRAFLAGAKAPVTTDLDTWGAADAQTRAAAASGVILRDGQAVPLLNVRDLRPGDQVVLRSEQGGYTSALGWAPVSKDPVEDVQVAAFAQGRPGDRAVVALTPATLAGWAARADAVPPAGLGALQELLAHPERMVEELGQVQDLVTGLGLEGVASLEESKTGGAPVLLLQRAPAWNASGGYSRPVLLAEHQRQVRDIIASAGAAAGLDAQLLGEAALVGRWHDEGKAHASFQAYLGNLEVAQPWAKSRTGTGNAVADTGQARAVGHPVGWRHEALSAAWCAGEGFSDLVVHLVASHHGRARPLLWSTADGPGQTEDPRAPRRFDLLNDRLGRWGLAYLEALVRLSDWRASEQPTHRPTSDALAPEETLSRTLAVLPSPVGVQEVPLFGLASSVMTGWYALAGLLRTVHDHDLKAEVRWLGDRHAVGFPVWRSELALQDAARLLMESRQWELLTSVGAGMGAGGLTAKSQKGPDVRAVAPVLRKAAEEGAWAVMALVQDWQRAGDGKAVLTLPAWANNSTFVGRALDVRDRDQNGTELTAALQDPLAGWQSGGNDGGMDRASGEVGVTGWESVQDSRPTRAALSPAALLGMAGLGAAGLKGVGPDSTGRRVELPLPQDFVDWPVLAASARGVSRFRGWVLEGTRWEPVSHTLVWANQTVWKDSK